MSTLNVKSAIRDAIKDDINIRRLFASTKPTF